APRSRACCTKPISSTTSSSNALHPSPPGAAQDGDRDSAEALARQAADHGDTEALFRLAQMRKEAGDRDSTEALARQAADYGDTNVLYRLPEQHELFTRLWPYGLDPDGTPSPPC
ncbi:hypothetical protein ABT011_35675, partial [Streptomyces virginiae]